MSIFSSARARGLDRQGTPLLRRDETHGVAIELNLPWRQLGWAEQRLAVEGHQAGCVERRDTQRMNWLLPNGTCEFDGRLALALHRGRRADLALISGWSRHDLALISTSETLSYTFRDPTRYPIPVISP